MKTILVTGGAGYIGSGLVRDLLSDGNTVIYNEKYDGEDGIYSTESIRRSGITNKLTIKKKIKPKENRLLIFEGLLIHKGHHPSKHNTRILLNSNFN